MATRMSQELEQLMPAGKKRYDAKKVMAWMNAYGAQLWLTLQQLEDEYEKHRPSTEFLAKTTKEQGDLMDELTYLMRPLFERYCAKDGYNPKSSQQHNEFMSLVGIALGGVEVEIKFGAKPQPPKPADSGPAPPEYKTPEEDHPVLLERQREWMRQHMPKLLSGLEPLIKEYKLSDHDAYDMLFDAKCGHDSGVKDKNTIEGMAYDLKHGIRPDKKT